MSSMWVACVHRHGPVGPLLHFCTSTTLVGNKLWGAQNCSAAEKQHY